MARDQTLPVSNASLTEQLRRLAAEMHTVTDGGNPQTRGEALAELIWKKALGWTETTRDDTGTLVKVYHKPESWAIQYIHERVEGKAATAALIQSEGSVRAADKVRDLARERLNAMAQPVQKKSPRGERED